MKSLYDAYSSINETYYHKKIDVKRLFTTGNTRNECRKFINRNFNSGGKGDALVVAFRDQYELDGKHEHTVSSYLMGLYWGMLAPRINNELKATLSYLINAEEWYDFGYTWLLTSLYHDIAACVEDDDNQDIPTVKYTPFGYPQRIENQGFIRFKEETIKKYFLYRSTIRKSEHGIVGGCLLFNKLYINFLRRTKDTDLNVPQIINGLCYRKEHIHHFAYIADAIICHNIWMSYDQNTYAIYQEKGLDELIIKNKEDRLKLEEYPLQFILCLIDTIEPVKRFSSLSPEMVLKNVYIEVADKVVKIGCTDIIKKQDGFFEWFGNIYELRKWMNVDVMECKKDDNMCYIEIKY